MFGGWADIVADEIPTRDRIRVRSAKVVIPKPESVSDTQVGVCLGYLKDKRWHGGPYVRVDVMGDAMTVELPLDSIDVDALALLPDEDSLRVQSIAVEAAQ